MAAVQSFVTRNLSLYELKILQTKIICDLGPGKLT